MPDIIENIRRSIHDVQRIDRENRTVGRKIRCIQMYREPYINLLLSSRDIERDDGVSAIYFNGYACGFDTVDECKEWANSHYSRLRNELSVILEGMKP